jgi:hypothetical protein
VGKEEE